MNSADWLAQATSRLQRAGIGTARLDSLVLLEDATDKDRAHLLAHPTTPLQDLILQRLNAQVERRAEHEPLAYIRGKCEFYGRGFIVNKHVLVPRPESETMIELLLQLCKIRSCKGVVDVGTGSGALAITARLELPGLEVTAIDIDPLCLNVATQNARKHSASINILQGNLLEPLAASHQLPDIILANLPYVPNDYKVNEAAAMEPHQAIYGGSDGLDLYRQLFKQINRVNKRVKFVFTESLPLQHSQLKDIAEAAGFRLKKMDDFIQLFELA